VLEDMVVGVVAVVGDVVRWLEVCLLQRFGGGVSRA
jgi:hypothetical protein